MKTEEDRARVGRKSVTDPHFLKKSQTFKKKYTGKRSHYSVLTVVLLKDEDFASIARLFARRGCGTLAGVSYATPTEAEQAGNSDSYVIWKYKSFSELYNLRGLKDHQWRVMCDQMEVLFPCRSIGQLRLF